MSVNIESRVVPIQGRMLCLCGCDGETVEGNKSLLRIETMSCCCLVLMLEVSSDFEAVFGFVTVTSPAHLFQAILTMD